MKKLQKPESWIDKNQRLSKEAEKVRKQVVRMCRKVERRMKHE